MRGTADQPGVAIFVNTPAQVHFYKNIVAGLQSKGKAVHVLARDYGETIPLLNELGIEYRAYSKPGNQKMDKVFSLPGDVLRACEWLRQFNIGLVAGFGVYDVYASALLGAPNLIFNDSEPFINSMNYGLEFKLFMPFVDNIVTPTYYRQHLGKKHIKVNSFKEMAYLHPSYYSPDDSVLDLLSISRNESYSLLRFNAFDAVHDMGIGGFTDDDKRDLVRTLEEFSSVFISSEKGVPQDLQPYILKIPKSRIHDALSYASLLVTDTQTMATESALLGTPTIRCNSFVGKKDMGNFLELEHSYGLLYSYADSKKAIQKAGELIKNRNLKTEWNSRRSRLLDDKIDISALMIWLMEDYPRNMNQLISYPESQGKFLFEKTAAGS